MTPIQYLLALACMVPLFVGVRTMVLHLWSRARVRQAGTALYDMAATELSSLQTRLEEAEAKSLRYFKAIETVIVERDGWRTLYHDQALGHDNAQHMMLEQITRLHQAYTRETGKPFQLPPIINAVREAWQQEHGQEARAELSKKPQTTEVSP